MGINLYIEKETITKDRINIDLSTYNFKDKTDYNQADEIFEYNDLFSKIVFQNYKDIKYLISPTLTRIEDQTYFYDKLFKYVHLVNLINKSTQNLMLKNIDYMIFESLLRYLKEKGSSCKYSFIQRRVFAFRKILKFILRLIINLVREVILLLASKLFISSAKYKSYDYAIISFYDHRSNLNGKYNDHYFSPLIDHMVRNDKKVIVLNTLLNKNRPFEVYRYIRDISKMNGNPEVKLCYQFITILDILKAYILGLSSRINLKQRIIFKNTDITYLTNLSLKDDYYKCAWFYTFMQYQFFKKIFKSHFFKNILYPYENHPWEKLLVLVRVELKIETKLVSFQHSSFSLKQLNHFPGKYEKKIPVFPDKILTVGRTLRIILEKYGNYPAGILQEGCALRHSYLFEGNQSVGTRDVSRKLAYAFSFDVSNYATILNNLIEIFKNTPYSIYLKLHPLTLKVFNFKRDLPRNFIIANDIPWKKLFEFIDILLYDDNSLGIDALKYNIEPIYFPFTNQIYNSDRLFKYEQKRIRTTSLRNFKSSIEKYYQEYDVVQAERKMKYNEEYFYSYFSPILKESLQRFM